MTTVSSAAKGGGPKVTTGFSHLEALGGLEHC